MIIIIIDIIFLLTEIRVWLSEDPGNDTWQKLRPMHNFGLFCWIVIMILKVNKKIFIDNFNRFNYKRNIRLEKSRPGAMIYHYLLYILFLNSINYRNE